MSLALQMRYIDQHVAFHTLGLQLAGLTRFEPPSIQMIDQQRMAKG